MSYTKVYNQQLSVEDEGLYEKITIGKTTLYVPQGTQESVIVEAVTILQEEKTTSTYLLCGEYNNIFHEIDDVYDLMEDGNSVTQRARFTLVESNLYHAEFNVPV